MSIVIIGSVALALTVGMVGKSKVGTAVWFATGLAVAALAIAQAL